MHFRSLPEQVASHLEEEINRGRWVSYLPGERSLAANLKVSRRTLTSALGQLQRDGIVRVVKARGHEIVSGGKRAGSTSPLRMVGLVTPESLEVMRPGATIWVKDLQSLMAERNLQLNLFHGNRYFSKHPGRALAKLTSANPQSAWLLVHSSESIQQWFAQSGIPAVAAGTCHPKVDLPDVDLDFYALGRHVAARLAGMHHRRAVLMLSNARGYVASELDCERGFNEVFVRSGGTPIVAYHERTRDGMARVMRRFITGSERPTAMVVTNSLDYLTVTSVLAQHGIRIPRDISVVARNDDAFLGAMLPTPSCYHVSPHVIARKIFKVVSAVVDGKVPAQPHVRIMPEFIAGESLAPAPKP